MPVMLSASSACHLYKSYLLPNLINTEQCRLSMASMVLKRYLYGGYVHVQVIQGQFECIATLFCRLGFTFLLANIRYMDYSSNSGCFYVLPTPHSRKIVREGLLSICQFLVHIQTDLSICDDILWSLQSFTISTNLKSSGTDYSLLFLQSIIRNNAPFITQINE